MTPWAALATHLRWADEPSARVLVPARGRLRPLILVCGRLLGAANRPDYILGRALEEQTGLSHTLFELLLVVGRAGPDGVPVRDIAHRVDRDGRVPLAGTYRRPEGVTSNVPHTGAPARTWTSASLTT